MWKEQECPADGIIRRQASTLQENAREGREAGLEREREQSAGGGKF